MTRPEAEGELGILDLDVVLQKLELEGHRVESRAQRTITGAVVQQWRIW